MTQDKKKRFTKRGLAAEVKLAIDACLAKKAEDLCVLDLRGLSGFTDFFLITNGNSSRQNAAIAESVEVRLRTAGRRPLGVEGRDSPDWVLVDYGWFVVHVFSRVAREHYALEKLWGDAPSLHF